MNKNIFEAWYDEADNSIALMPLSEVQRIKAIEDWLKEPIFLHRIEAESLEAASRLHQEKMDWDNFWVQKDLIQLCQGCGVRYLLRLSIACPNCGHDPEA